jgi:hypothetical protein
LDQFCMTCSASAPAVAAGETPIETKRSNPVAESSEVHQ